MDPTASSADTLPTGSRLQNYRIARLLGRGGFGVIYLAVDVNLAHRVAIKEYLPSEIAARAEDSRVFPSHENHADLYQWGLDRFVKEARNLVRFRHPNIVRVTSLFQENNTAYMVMDFEQGHSLREFMQIPANRSESSLKKLIKPIAQGLSEVHRQGFIHRDIKPGNLLVRDDGTPVLLDFGSARLASREATHGLTALVSSGYAPLEQYNPESEEQQGPWSDIYALSGVMYYCISQQDPPDSTQRSLAIVNGQADPLVPATVAGDAHYSDAFLRAIDWALSVRIADRPQTLGDWIPALFATGVPPDATLTTQHLLDQQTRLASAVPAVPAAPVKAEDTAAVSSAAVTDTMLEDENWALAMAAAEQNAAQDTVSRAVAEPVRRRGFLHTRRRLQLGWVFSLCILAAMGAAGWFVYGKVISWMDSQQAAVDAQKRVADEALAAAESARLEAQEAMAAQREQTRLQLQSAAEQERRVATRRAAEKERAEQARLADEASKQAQQEAALREARQRAAQKRQQSDALLDSAEQALAENDVISARIALEAADSLGVENIRLQDVSLALAAAEENARQPITDAEFENIVARFHQLKEAIEQGDLVQVEQLTQGESEQALFRGLIEKFKGIDISINGIRVRNADKSIVGTLRIERMLRDNGNRTVPGPSYRDRVILSRRVNGEWSVIVW